MIWTLAFAAPELEPERFDPRLACEEHAGAVQHVGKIPAAQRIALVVGVPCHEDVSIPSLQFATSDALRFGALLEERGYAVHALTTQVTRADLERALDAVAAALPPDGELVLYFSGHGVLRESGEQLHRYLVFSDSDLGDIQRTGLSIEELEAMLQSIEAARRVVVQDSCYAAGQSGKGLGMPAGFKALSLPGPALQAVDTRLYASRFYEIATESPTLGGSVYTSHLIESLNKPAADLDGDGCVGLLEGHFDATASVVEAREGYQHPVWAGSIKPEGCKGEALRGVVLEHGVLSGVAPGRVGTGGSRRWVRAGEWVELTPKKRWRLQAGVRGAGRRWTVSPGSVGLEATVLRASGSGTPMLGVRGAWAIPTHDGAVRLAGGELLARAGWLTSSRLQVGGLLEVGTLFVVPQAPGADLPLQASVVFGALARVQWVWRRLYLSSEGGVDVALGATRPILLPTLAGSLGVQL